MDQATQIKIMQELTTQAIENIIAQGLMTRDQVLETMAKMSIEEIKTFVKVTSDFLNKELA